MALPGTRDATVPAMKHVLHLHVLIAVCAATAAGGCVATSTTWTTARVDDSWAQFGTVESVQQITLRVPGVPGGPAVGAVAGALIGGYLSRGDGPSTVLAAAAGAAIGASASQRGSETRSYRVRVRFDDGSWRTFVFDGSSPFWPGDPIVLTPRGLMHA